MPSSVQPAVHSYYSQRLRLNYVTWGDPSKPPLLLQHGMRDHCRSWDWVAQRFCRDWYVIAPDLRGHGDSDWAVGGDYSMLGFVYDLAELIRQLGLAPLTIVGHSLGGNVTLRYTGIYPENVRKLVVIEGLGPSPKMLAEEEARGVAERLRGWIEGRRRTVAKSARRMASFDEALARMKANNRRLSDEQARHLTQHALRRHEDGSYGWKYDPFLLPRPPYDLPLEEMQRLWARVECPTLLIYGKDSWASNPAEDGRAAHFRNARVVMVDDAGHWVHHDQFEYFCELLREFL